jgi:hypothetical protein
MSNSKILLIGLLLHQWQTVCSQQFSVETNAVYINAKKVNAEVVKLPLINWLSPKQINSNSTDDSVTIRASVYSNTMLKSLSLKLSAGLESSITKFPLVETSFSGEQIIKKKVWLVKGLNTLELIAESMSGGKVSSTRFIEANRKEGFSPAISSKIGSPLLLVKENSIVFTDSNKDGFLNANEEATVKFILINKGKVAGKDLELSHSIAGNRNDIEVKPDEITRLEPGEEEIISTRIIAGGNLAPGKVSLSLVVMEPKGFDSDSIKVQFNTEEYKPPVINIADVVFNSVIGNKLKRNTPAGFQVLIQNTGFGNAEEVKVSVTFPENIYFDGDNVTDIGNLSSGEAKKLSFEFIPTTRYKSSEIPIKITIIEKSGKYGSEKIVTPVLDQTLATMQLSVTGDKPKQVILPVSLRSDVDINIPETTFKHPNRYALVIGNEDYVQFQPLLNSEQNVKFARNDAIVFRDYLVKTLGVPEKNAFLLLDATRGQITRELERVTELAKLRNDSELILYYAGHGLPDFETRKGYIIPVDISGGNITDGISLADLYAKLALTESRRITVFIDACFSGGGRGENGLLAARTVKVKPVGDIVDGNIVVFTATSSEEVSLPLQKESHGLFTYYLLRKFKETSGQFTMQDLKDYLKNEIPKSSLLENRIKQTPQVLVSPKLDDQWLLWKF